MATLTEMSWTEVGRSSAMLGAAGGGARRERRETRATASASTASEEVQIRLPPPLLLLLVVVAAMGGGRRAVAIAEMIRANVNAWGCTGFSWLTDKSHSAGKPEQNVFVLLIWNL